jgi:hypothetical protein
MSKNLKIAVVIVLALGLVSCADQGGLKAGTATSRSMLKLLPADSRVVLMVDVHRGLATDAAQNALKDPQAKLKYDEFVKTSGLDPMKDIYFLAVAATGTIGGKDMRAALVLNLKYNKETFLAKLKEKAKDLQEEPYNGVIVYKGPAHTAAGGQVPAGAFLDDSNIVLGQEKLVRAVIDVYQKKADSVAKNPEMKKYFKAVNTDAIFWGAASVPQDLVKAQADKNAMLKDLVGLTGLTMSFDYANKMLIAEVQALGGGKEQNKALAEKLSAVKGMGAMMAGQQPVLGELLGKVEISSSSDNVKIYAGIPYDLLEKAQKVAQEKVGQMIQVSPQAGKDEKKDEKKEEVKK